MNEASTIINELRALGKEEQSLILQRFFKTGEGEYGEGDLFLGVMTPKVREVARRHLDAELQTIEELIASHYNEVRCCALFIMVEKIKAISKRTWIRNNGEDKAEKIRKGFYEFYLAHTHRVNNWNLVDLSCPIIIGEYLKDKPRDILYQLAESSWLWDNRIAMVSTFAFIKNADLDDTFRLAEKMMHHPHQLMHKAIGWMLREAGKRDILRLKFFLDIHATQMPRTMLRYAIEKFGEEDRQHYLKMK